MNRYELLDKIDDLTHELGTVQGKYLGLTGWVYTSETPGSYWMWRKTMPSGERLLMTVKDALHAQAHMDEDEEPRSSESEEPKHG
jgi:hypothetical protein